MKYYTIPTKFAKGKHSGLLFPTSKMKKKSLIILRPEVILNGGWVFRMENKDVLNNEDKV